MKRAAADRIVITEPVIIQNRINQQRIKEGKKPMGRPLVAKENRKVQLNSTVTYATKHLLALATETYGLSYQSEMVEKILRTGLEQVLDKADVDWKQYLIDEGLAEESSN